MSYQLTGLIVVFTALGLIWGLLEVVGLFFRRPVQTHRAAPAPAAPETSEAGLRPELVVAISAAVHEALGEGARIRAIVPVATRDWAHEGRRQIFSSHQPR